MNEEAIDLAAVPEMTSLSSSSYVLVEDKGSIGKITLEQLKSVLDQL